MKYIIETTAVLFSIISVVLAMRKSIHNWTTGAIGIVMYMLVFYSEKLYADFFLQFIFLGQSVWGYYAWRKEKSMEPSIVNRLYVFAFVLFCIIYCIFGKNTGNPYPLVDSLATTFSIVAIYLMSKKHLSCWLWWIAADIIYIFLFLSCRLYLSACLYTLFLFMSVSAFTQWKNYEQKI